VAQIDLKAAKEEFTHLKQSAQNRNNIYYLNRQAVKGNFRWPLDWPHHIARITDNLCKPIVERFTTYLMGKGFSWNIERPNSMEFREAAERSEKILKRLMRLSDSDLQFQEGAKMGSEMGRTIFKVYKQGKPGYEHACFQTIQPDYFYPIFSGGGHVAGRLAGCYYSYPIDRAEAERLYGKKPYKSEAQVAQGDRYEDIREHNSAEWNRDPQMRRIPVLEVWTLDSYALVVGDIVIYNGDNPYVWSDTGEGFVPFVVVENIRNAGEAQGEADIQQARELNEHLNFLLSRKAHVVSRWLTPTLVWEGAPPNYADVLANTQKGGGAIPVRLGARLSFLAHDRPMPSVVELEQTFRLAILETAGMNEVALQGITTGSINTGPALAAQFQPVLSTIEKKRLAWQTGLELLFAMLLEVQETIGDSKALGQAVINETEKSSKSPSGELVDLSGLDIKGLREVNINWPGVLPKDDTEAARLELEKMSQGVQSMYTTMEKLGEEFPDDELARIRMEAQDSGLRGDKVAEQMRAQTPLITAGMQQETQLAQMQAQMAQAAMQQQGQGAPPELGDPDPMGDEFDTSGIGARLRELARSSAPKLNLDDDMPAIEAGSSTPSY
jgi:hypothetical protein